MMFFKQKSVFSHISLGLPKTAWRYCTPWVGAFVFAGFMVGSIAQEAGDPVEASDSGIEEEVNNVADTSNYEVEEEGSWTEVYELPDELVFQDPPEDAVEGDAAAENAGEEELVDYGAPDEEIPALDASEWDFPPPVEQEDAEVSEEDVNTLADEDVLPEEEDFFWDSEPDKDGISADNSDNGTVGEDVTPSGLAMEEVEADGAVDKYIGKKWIEFSSRKAGTLARGCYPADRQGLRCVPSRAKNSIFANAPAWTFTAKTSVRLYVTDAFDRRDRFKVYDSGKLLGETSKPSGSGNCGSDPARCFNDKSASSGAIDLPPGRHAITIVPSVVKGGAVGYFLLVPISTPKKAGTLQFHTSSYRVKENVRSVAILVTRQGGNYGNVSVRYSTANRTARNGSDYRGQSGTLVWRHGDSRTKVIRINLINDSNQEPTEYFTVHLSNVRGGARIGRSGTVVYIYDDDIIRCNAVFDAKNRRLHIPLINIPLLDPITGRPIGTSAVFKGSLQMVEGVEDFKVIPSSMSFVKMLTKNTPCNAYYNYSSRQIYIPRVNVPSVMVVPPNVVVPGPTQVFQVRLQQLPLSDQIFHLVYYRYLHSYK